MRTVLLTGGSGVIGGALTGLLLGDGVTEVRLLLRAQSTARLEQRVRSLPAFCNRDVAAAVSPTRLRAFAGDVSRPLLGLDRATYDELTREVTHVVHAAGNVKLNQSLADARTSALEGTRHIVAFVQAAVGHGTFRKLEHISTVGVAGRLPGIVPERRLVEARGFRNTYEAAKAEAEEMLFEEMDRGLPVTVHRPSMVVGDSRTGVVPSFQVFYYLCEWLSGQRTWGIVPDAGDLRLDIIPVDYVVRAIALALDHPDAAGRVFHLCSGPSQALPINTLSEHVAVAFGRHRGRQIRLRRVSPRLVRRLLPLARAVAPPRVRRGLEAVPFFLSYLDERQAFDNTETRGFFASNGLSIPPVAAYLDHVLEFYLRTRDDRRPG
jgi:thioester reductase-like protein